MIERGIDIFYVEDMFGLNFHSEARQTALEAKLHAAMKEGPKRAAT